MKKKNGRPRQGQFALDTNVNITMSKELIAALDDARAMTGMSRSALVRRLMRHGSAGRIRELLA